MGISRLLPKKISLSDLLLCMVVIYFRRVFSDLIPLKRGVMCSVFSHDFLLFFTSLQIEVDNRSGLVPLFLIPCDGDCIPRDDLLNIGLRHTR